MMLKTYCSFAATFCFLLVMPTLGLAQDQTAAENKPLAAVLEAQPEKIKARYKARNPSKTLAFFEVKQGDVVIEALPGRGWYSGILYPYLGEKGQLIGAHTPRAVFERIGWKEERIQKVMKRYENWTQTIADASIAKGGKIDQYNMTEMPDRFAGVADKVLFVRALHGLSRFNSVAGYRDTVIAEAFRSLKPGGIVGVVQHHAPEEASDKWADGNNGYLKKSDVIRAFEKAGFKFLEARNFNANPKDRPTESDFVWRLAPTFRGSEPDTEKRRKYEEIGESNRMTLKFVKPAQ